MPIIIFMVLAIGLGFLLVGEPELAGIAFLVSILIFAFLFPGFWIRIWFWILSRSRASMIFVKLAVVRMYQLLYQKVRNIFTSARTRNWIDAAVFLLKNKAQGAVQGFNRKPWFWSGIISGVVGVYFLAQSLYLGSLGSFGIACIWALVSAACLITHYNRWGVVKQAAKEVANKVGQAVKDEFNSKPSFWTGVLFAVAGSGFLFAFIWEDSYLYWYENQKLQVGVAFLVMSFIFFVTHFQKWAEVWDITGKGLDFAWKILSFKKGRPIALILWIAILCIPWIMQHLGILPEGGEVWMSSMLTIAILLSSSFLVVVLWKKANTI